ncbi:dihydrofolate reductase [Arabidopsis thaliana]|uniref:Dihydrofolate reductase n=1 Tax=Arabidopsis thaliana TaxID=3702 RepID=A0A1P8B8P4_ARATH|nr:dihydrofolate reductase [Arabidopsis thaliana]ANM67962.1 dihydrofolate reductase [Arabidopsis thaliana]|eukprot:NP_001329753.1 dihydrofolate reductase [Arabidopsis thaliana]
MHLFLVKANLMSKASLILLITSGFNSTRSFVFLHFLLFILLIRMCTNVVIWIQEFTEYTNFEKCLEYLEDRMIKLGPFDGLIGFSQGAILSGGLPGLQAKGIAFQKVPKIKFVIIIGGAKLKSAKLAENAYSSSLETLSLHFLGETDFLKPYGTQLIESYKNPVVVHHPKGHTVPRLDEKSLEKVTAFIDTLEHLVMEEDKNGEENTSKPTK